MVKCVLAGSDHDRAIIDIDQPGDTITYQGETYTRHTVNGRPHNDGLGRPIYRWIYPLSGDKEQTMRRAP